MGPLNDENKLQVKYTKKLKKNEKNETKNIINFKTICYELTANSNIIHSILN